MNSLILEFDIDEIIGKLLNITKYFIYKFNEY